MDLVHFTVCVSVALIYMVSRQLHEVSAIMKQQISHVQLLLICLSDIGMLVDFIRYDKGPHKLTEIHKHTAHILSRCMMVKESHSQKKSKTHFRF